MMVQQAAVLTGDLVKSTRSSADQIDVAMKVLSQVALNIADDTRFTRFRGDGWQIYLHGAHNCLTASLQILAVLKAAGTGLETRISVGIGEIWKLPDTDLAAAAGPAFTASGRGLDDMNARQILTIQGKSVDRMQQTLFAFAADRADRWSHEQAEAMALALDAAMPSRASIARMLGISRQAVEARLAAAGHRLLEDANLAFFERYAPPGWSKAK